MAKHPCEYCEFEKSCVEKLCWKYLEWNSKKLLKEIKEREPIVKFRPHLKNKE